MAIERESNFTSSAPFSAAWGYVEGSFSNVCLTQGRTFVERLRLALRMPSGSWDDALQSQLISLATSLGAGWQIVLSDLRAALAARSLVGHDLSLQFGIWVAYYRAHGRRFDAIRIFSGTVPPVWGVLPPPPRGSNVFVAYDPSVEQDPMYLDASALAVAVSRSSTGVRIEPGRPVPAGPRIVTQESAVSTTVVIVVSVLVVVGVVALTRTRSEAEGP